MRIGDFLRFARTNFCGVNGLKLPLGTNFCSFLFKQQDYFQLVLLFGKNPSCGILETLEDGVR